MDGDKVPKQFDPMIVSDSPVRDDVVGQAGKFIDDFILATKSEGIYKTMGVKSDKTFLITGKPGTGKTMGIEALLNESNREYVRGFKINELLPIGLVGMSYDIGKFGTAYINMGSKIAQNFFDICYNFAQHHKVLIVFDEAEVLFGDRTGNYSHKEDSKLLNTIMKNMQKIHDIPNIYAVMMSNHPEAFDEASIRAGRIDKRYEFLLPNKQERDFAYEHTIKKINQKAGYQVVRCFDTDKLSEISNEFSYADIVQSVNSAVKKRAKEISKVRTNKIITAGYVTQKRLEDSVNSHKEGFYSTKRKIGFI